MRVPAAVLALALGPAGVAMAQEVATPVETPAERPVDPLDQSAEPVPAPAGSATDAPVQSPVLIVNLDAVFSGTLYGRRIVADLEAAFADLRAENERIAAAFRAEELELTERRAETDVDAFRALAEDFDTRAEAARREQDAKERALQARLDESQADFVTAIEPVMVGLMAERGAAVILPQPSVYLAIGPVDVTDAAIAAVDAALGAGPAP